MDVAGSKVLILAYQCAPPMMPASGWCVESQKQCMHRQGIYWLASYD